MLVKIAKNFSYLIMAQIGYKLLSFFSIAYVARIIGDAKFGQLSFVLYLGLLFFALADMGLSEVYICEAAGEKEKEREIMRFSMGSRILFSLMTFLLLIVLAFLLGVRQNSIVLILLIGVSMILDSFTLFLRSVFRAREKMKYEAISFTVEGLIKFSLLILAVRIFRTNLLMIAVALLITSIFAFLLTMLICKNKFLLVSPSFNKSEFLKLFKRGLPFAIIGFLSIVSLKIDVIMLAKMSTDSVTGWYSAAVKFVESVLVIPVTLSIVLFPVISRLYKNSKDNFIYMYKFSTASCIVFGLLMSLLIYSSSDFFINLIFGNGFVNSVYIVKILSLTIAPFFIKFFLERTALVLNKAGILLKAYIGGVILKIIFNFLFIPVMNYQGAAFSSLAIEVLIVVYILYALQVYLKSHEIKVAPSYPATEVLFLHEER